MAKNDFISHGAIEARLMTAAQAITEMLVIKGYVKAEVYSSPDGFSIYLTGICNQPDYGLIGLTWERAVAAVRDLPIVSGCHPRYGEFAMVDKIFKAILIAALLMVIIQGMVVLALIVRAAMS